MEILLIIIALSILVFVVDPKEDTEDEYIIIRIKRSDLDE